MPNEPKLYMIYNGVKFVNYNDEQDLMNRVDESESDYEDDEE